MNKNKETMGCRRLSAAIFGLTLCMFMLGGCGPESEPAAGEESTVRSAVTATLIINSAAEVRSRAQKHGLGPLGAVPVPEPKLVELFVVDVSAARALGKALFWDQQIGSDGQACASCHFHAGADNRTKNQLNPAFNSRTTTLPNGDFRFGNTELNAPSPTRFRANYNLVREDFPFHKLSNPDDRNSPVLSDTNDVVSSQGVFNAFFRKVAVPFDVGDINRDGFGVVFNVNGALVRNVEPRQTPTIVNAVFNLRNFWDGRARQEFNGVSPIGKLDPNAQIGVGWPWGPSFVRVRIERASLASQAVGPPVSDLEMSFAQRRFADLGRKMLAPITMPLVRQRVHVQDSLLGPYSRQNLEPGLRGLSVRYADAVRKVFRQELWDGRGNVVDVNGTGPRFVSATAPGPGQYTLMEWNFALFFGLAVNLYEATLVSDETPFDKFMEGNDFALTEQQLRGLDVFIDKGKCANCHGGNELTNASVRNAGSDPIERMIMSNGRVAVYDNGFYNIGVRPTREDLGVGARTGPSNLPLSDARRHQECVKASMSTGSSLRDANVRCDVPRLKARADEARILIGKVALLLPSGDVNALLASADVALTANRNAAAFAALVKAHALLSARAAVGSTAAALLSDAAGLLPDPIEPGPDPERPHAPRLKPNERIAANGMFKTPSLRNIELTAPYFHNGGQATLAQVVQFYNRGGDFSDQNRADMDPDIQRLNLTLGEQADLVAFMMALTDERVRFDRAPFDHPSLDVPTGGTPGVLSFAFFPVGVLDDRILVPEVGRNGSAIKLGTPHSVFANFLDPLR